MSRRPTWSALTVCAASSVVAVLLGYLVAVHGAIRQSQADSAALFAAQNELRREFEHLRNTTRRVEPLATRAPRRSKVQ